MNDIQLTATEKLIYDQLLKIISNKDKIPVKEIAKKVGVAPSSIVKLAKKLGYKGWNEMFYVMSNSTSDTIPISFEKFGKINLSEGYIKIQQLSEMLIDYFDYAIVVATIGDSKYLDEYVVGSLRKRGFKAYHNEKGIVDMIVNNNMAGIAIIINESGVAYTNLCIDLKEKHFNIISITSNQDSPLASNSHISVKIQNNKSNLIHYEPNYFTARVMIFLELLFVEIDKKRKIQ